MLLEGCGWATLDPGDIAVAHGYPAWRPAYPAAVPFSRTGADSHPGMNGIGVDAATLSTRRFKIRDRGGLFVYGTHVAPRNLTNHLHGTESVGFRGVGYAF
jgi:hypothetical protein